VGLERVEEEVERVVLEVDAAVVSAEDTEVLLEASVDVEPASGTEAEAVSVELPAEVVVDGLDSSVEVELWAGPVLVVLAASPEVDVGRSRLELKVVSASVLIVVVGSGTKTVLSAAQEVSEKVV
jgi:hypothetical protein